jgi:hypothetical protein
MSGRLVVLQPLVVHTALATLRAVDGAGVGLDQRLRVDDEPSIVALGELELPGALDGRLADTERAERVPRVDTPAAVVLPGRQ